MPFWRSRVAPKKPRMNSDKSESICTLDMSLLIAALAVQSFVTLLSTNKPPRSNYNPLSGFKAFPHHASIQLDLTLFTFRFLEISPQSLGSICEFSKGSYLVITIGIISVAISP